MKRWRVRRWARRCFWRGFMAYVGGMDHGQIGKLAEGPRWWQDVLDIAYNGGQEYAAELLGRREQFPVFPDDDIPADVLADCYAAASR